MRKDAGVNLVIFRIGSHLRAPWFIVKHGALQRSRLLLRGNGLPDGESPRRQALEAFRAKP